MRGSLERRLAALEARVSKDRVLIVLLVTFRSGKAEEAMRPSRIVGVGGVWTREPGEDVEAFRQKAMAEATPIHPNSVAVLVEEYDV